MKRLPLLLSVASGAVISAIAACGGISDPNKSQSEHIASVSGALTGMTVPSGAHVALVWRTGAIGYAVGNDVEVINGQFTMDLSAPPDGYFINADTSSFTGLSGSGNTSVEAPSSGSGGGTSATAPIPVTVDASAGPSGSNGHGASSGYAPSFNFSQNVHTQTQVGGSITQPLTIAMAGFVVYIDANGNGQLDLQGDYADSPDQIIGGDSELLLTYLRDGGALDYEKLRDHSGILPTSGYNLHWDQGRWVPLTEVELKLQTPMNLPTGVCQSLPVGSPGNVGGPSSATTIPVGQPPYPSKGDPKLHCYNGGYGWTYDGGWLSSCPPPPPPPVGLCAPTDGVAFGCAGMGGESINPGFPVPVGWPCDIDQGFADAGVPADAGCGPRPVACGGPAADAGPLSSCSCSGSSCDGTKQSMTCDGTVCTCTTDGTPTSTFPQTLTSIQDCSTAYSKCGF